MKDISGDHYADNIEKTTNLAGCLSRLPVPGEPFSDLELPTGSHTPQDDRQAALEKRRETIRGMAHSPTVNRTVSKT